MTPLAAALWTTALWVVENVCVGVTQAMRPGALSDVVNLGACTALATSLLVFVMVRVHARDVSLRATLGVVRPATLHVVLAIAAGAGLYPLLSTIDDLAQKRWPSQGDESETLAKLLAVPTMSARVALVVSAFVVIPLARELFFRGLVYGEVRRATSVRAATIASAAFYAASQLDWRTLPTTLVLGLALARLRERSGSVVAPIAAHFAYWAVVAVPILRGRDPMENFAYPTRWIVGGAVIAVLALAAVGIGSRRDE
jgi:membrane protease YdiL (CAAX protease family)